VATLLYLIVSARRAVIVARRSSQGVAADS